MRVLKLIANEHQRTSRLSRIRLPLVAVNVFLLLFAMQGKQALAGQTQSASAPGGFTDNFSTDASLNTSLWTTPSDLLMKVAGAGEGGNRCGSLPNSLVLPILNFGPNGMAMSGTNGLQQFTGIQSSKTLSPPFTFQTTVTGTVVNGNPFEIFFVSVDLREWFSLYGNVSAANQPYQGIKLGCELFYQNTAVGVPYTITVSASANGIFSTTLSTGATVLATKSVQVGNGPFYLVLGQGEGWPNTGGTKNVAIWQSVAVKSSRQRPIRSVNGSGPTSSTLLLVSGKIDGQNVSPANRTITVAPGAAITGSLTVSINSHWYPDDVMAMGVAPTWGDPSTSFVDLGGFGNPAIELQRTINLNLTAPTASGTYYIIAAYNATFTAAQVMSETNWSAGAAYGYGRGWADWSTGDAIADWTTSTVNTANSAGAVTVNCLASTGPNETLPVKNVPCYTPATAIQVVVRPSGQISPSNSGQVNGTPAGAFFFGPNSASTNPQVTNLLKYMNSTMVVVPGEQVNRIYDMTCTNQEYESPQGCGALHPLSLGQITVLMEEVLPAVYAGSTIYSYCGPEALINGVGQASQYINNASFEIGGSYILSTVSNPPNPPGASTFQRRLQGVADLLSGLNSAFEAGYKGVAQAESCGDIEGLLVAGAREALNPSTALKNLASQLKIGAGGHIPSLDSISIIQAQPPIIQAVGSMPTSPFTSGTINPGGISIQLPVTMQEPTRTAERVSLTAQPSTSAVGGQTLIMGTVRDKSQNPVVGVEIELTASEKGIQAGSEIVKTGTNGSFLVPFTAPPMPGDVTIRARIVGANSPVATAILHVRPKR